MDPGGVVQKACDAVEDVQAAFERGTRLFQLAARAVDLGGCEEHRAHAGPVDSLLAHARSAPDQLVRPCRVAAQRRDDRETGEREQDAAMLAKLGPQGETLTETSLGRLEIARPRLERAALRDEARFVERAAVRADDRERGVELRAGIVVLAVAAPEVRAVAVQ